MEWVHRLCLLVAFIAYCVSCQYIPEIPEECEHQGYCEKVPNYPHKYVAEIVRQLNKSGFIWQSDWDLRRQQTTGNDTQVNLCKSRKEYLTMEAAQHVSGKWHFIVNKCIIGVEICDHTEGQPCGTGLDIKLYYNGRTSRCVQRRLERYLWGLDESGALIQGIYQIASCCACAVFH